LHCTCPPAHQMAPVSASTGDFVDYYDFLSIESTATDQEIQRAYRRTNLKYHPDKFKPTPDTSVEQAAAKLDLLQQILAVLKDPAKRAEYDQVRETKRRNAAAHEKLEANRKRLKVDLDNREKKAAMQTDGLKRKRSEHEEQVMSAQAASMRLKQAMEKQREEERTQEKEAAEAQTTIATPAEPEQRHRTVKITWVKEGAGLDIDDDALKEMGEKFGHVESVGTIKDKKRRINGQKEKTVLGNGFVVFATLSAAEEAVRTATWDGIESVAWAFTKDTT
jgi:DnaJ family protein C protein 17